MTLLMLRFGSHEVSSNEAKKLLRSEKRFEELTESGEIRTRIKNPGAIHAKVYCNTWDIMKALIATSKDRDRVNIKEFEKLFGHEENK